MKLAIAFFLMLPCALVARQSTGGPPDTSFTVTSAARGIASQYPKARIVMPELPGGVVADTGIVYAVYGGRSLRLDLFRPDDRKSRPAVLLIHGGGWRSGDRSLSIPLAMALAGRGFVAAAVEYRLSPEARYPAAVYDLKGAIRWLRAQGTARAIDTSRIAALGCSAGGQLAALLGATNGDQRFEGDGNSGGHSSTVQAVVDIDGILDFTDPAESGKDTIPGRPSAGAAWLGATYRENPSLWIDASALAHAGPRTPPIEFINSSHPRFHAGRDSMIAILNRYAIPSEVHTIPDTPHPFWLFHPWFEPTSRYAAQFLIRIFGTPPERGRRQ